MTRRRGFTLVEVLLALMLLGVFSLLAFRLIYANFDIARSTLMADENSARFYGAVHTLRDDVFNCTSVEMPAPTQLRIHGPGNQVIDWKKDGISFSRSTGNIHRDWNFGRSVNLKLDGVVVLISGNPGDEIAMASIHSGAKP